MREEVGEEIKYQAPRSAWLASGFFVALISLSLSNSIYASLLIHFHHYSSLGPLDRMSQPTLINSKPSCFFSGKHLREAYKRSWHFLLSPRAIALSNEAQFFFFFKRGCREQLKCLNHLPIHALLIKRHCGVWVLAGRGGIWILSPWVI